MVVARKLITATCPSAGNGAKTDEEKQQQKLKKKQQRHSAPARDQNDRRGCRIYYRAVLNGWLAMVGWRWLALLHKQFCNRPDYYRPISHIMC